MNNLVLRTDKNSYFAGETIYGVVYLDICSPTSANGIKIIITGQEGYCLTEIESGKIEEDQCDHIDFAFHVYETDGPLPIGHYKCPFRKTLPDYCPNTFHCDQQNKQFTYQLSISYMIKASLVGAENMSDWHNLIIKDKGSKNLSKSAFEDIESSLQLPKYLGLLKGNITTKARLDKHIYHPSETVKLHLDVQNDSGKTITGIDIQLIQELNVKPSRSRSISRSSDSGINQDVDFLLHKDQPRFDLTCDGGKTVLWKRQGGIGNNTNINKGLSTIFIELSNKDGQNICPSTKGRFVTCLYKILVTIMLQNNNVLNITVPIGNVDPLEENQWENTNYLWMYDCSMHQNKKFDSYVPQEILESEYFSTFPGFEIL